MFQVELESGGQVAGYDFEKEQRTEKVSRIRVIYDNPEEKIGLFLNNNPYLIYPTFTDGIWELDTKGNVWINAIKFIEEYSKPIVIEFYYD